MVDIPNTVNPPGWVANDANSRWVWVTPAASPTAFDPPSLTVMMETHFTLPSNANLNDVTLAFRMAADDAITAVRVNGVLVPGANWASFGSFSPLITVNAASFGGPNPFVIGDNVLEFTIVDNRIYGGFRLEVNGSATQYGEIPEPASLTMLGGGLLALVYGIRRKSAA